MVDQGKIVVKIYNFPPTAREVQKLLCLYSSSFSCVHVR